MQTDEKKDLLFFAEWAPYNDRIPGEKEEAIQYLKLWKKFHLKKLKGELFEYEPHEPNASGELIKTKPDEWYEHWIDQPPWMCSSFALFGRVVLKFCMRKKLPNQIN